MTTLFKRLALRFTLFSFIALLAVTADAGLDTSRFSLSFQLYRESGLHEQIVRIPSSTIQSFEAVIDSGSLPAVLEEIEPAALRAALPKAFSAKRFETTLLDEFNETLTKSDIDTLLHWFRSPSGLRVRQAERDNSLLTESERYLAFQQQLSSHTPSPERIQTIVELDRVLQASAAAVDTMMNLQIAFTISLQPSLPVDQQMSVESVVRVARLSKGELLKEYQEQSIHALLFIYQNLSSSELDRMIKILDSSAGQRFISATNRGLATGMFDAGVSLGRALGALVEGQDNRPVI